MSPIASRSLVMLATVCGLSDTSSTISRRETRPCLRITSRTMRRLKGALDCWVVPRLTMMARRLYTQPLVGNLSVQSLRWRDHHHEGHGEQSKGAKQVHLNQLAPPGRALLSAWALRLSRRNIARTLDAVRTARYERTLAPRPSLEYSCAKRLRTFACGAPVRSHNEVTARSCLTASLSGSKSGLIETL